MHKAAPKKAWAGESFREQVVRNPKITFNGEHQLATLTADDRTYGTPGIHLFLGESSYSQLRGRCGRSSCHGLGSK